MKQKGLEMRLVDKLSTVGCVAIFFQGTSSDGRQLRLVVGCVGVTKSVESWLFVNGHKRRVFHQRLLGIVLDDF